MNLNKTENTAVLGIFLAFTGLLAALLLAFFADITAKPIAEAAAESANKSLASVMPPFKTKKTAVFNKIKFTGVYDEKGVLAGVAGETSVKGYGGDIRTLAGMNPDGSPITLTDGESARKGRWWFKGYLVSFGNDKVSLYKNNYGEKLLLEKALELSENGIKISLTCKGDTLSLRVNGENIFERVGNTYSSKTFGFFFTLL